MGPIDDNELMRRVIGCAMEVHHHLGPGLLESIYEECLCLELDQAGIRYVRQQRLPVRYKNHDIDCTFQLDMIVE